MTTPMRPVDRLHSSYAPGITGCDGLVSRPTAADDGRQHRLNLAMPSVWAGTTHRESRRHRGFSAA